MHYSFGGVTIDLSNTVAVSAFNVPAFQYECLADPERRKIRQSLRSRHADASRVLDRVKSWKYDSSNLAAMEHEATAKAITGDTSPIRGPSAHQPTQSERDTLKDLYDLSIELCRHRFGPAFWIYRGLGYESAFLLEEVLQNGTQSTYDPPRSVLSNYSTSYLEAAGFIPLVAATEVVPSDVLLAANYLFVWADPGHRYATPMGWISPNGELRVRDAVTRPFDSRELHVVTGDPSNPSTVSAEPFNSFMSKFPDQFSTVDHEVMYRLLGTVADEPSVSITGGGSRAELRRWIRACHTATGRSRSDLNSLVRRVT